jgi:hypothetical protein
LPRSAAHLRAGRPLKLIRCVDPGSRMLLERWHRHEYELQLIVGARGRAFAGAYVGRLEPDQLVLPVPRLPHNWVSPALPPNSIEVRPLARCWDTGRRGFSNRMKTAMPTTSDLKTRSCDSDPSTRLTGLNMPAGRSRSNDKS